MPATEFKVQGGLYVPDNSKRVKAEQRIVDALALTNTLLDRAAVPAETKTALAPVVIQLIWAEQITEL